MPTLPHHRVARRAYELFEARGRQHGHDGADWLQAERELVGDSPEWWQPGSPELYDLTGNNPASWYWAAKTLVDAGSRVKFEDEPIGMPGGTEGMWAVDGVYAMILGYAIESLLKGLWVKAENKIALNGKLQRIDGVQDHQLGQLARKLQEPFELPLDVAELSVLDRISAFVLYAGRYPIPTSAQQMRPRTVPNGGIQAPQYFSRDDFAIAERLVRRFMEDLTPWEAGRPKRKAT